MRYCMLHCVICDFFFFFKQKTAYEMRISDWSSDVCSSDLTQGRTLAVMQVCGGSQSFNVVNALRQLGRWMRMVTIPNQSSVPKAWQEFDDDGRMKPSPYYDRVVDVMEELVKFTLLVRGRRRSEEHTSELQSLMRISYAVF